MNMNYKQRQLYNLLNIYKIPIEDIAKMPLYYNNPSEEEVKKDIEKLVIILSDTKKPKQISIELGISLSNVNKILNINNDDDKTVQTIKKMKEILDDLKKQKYKDVEYLYEFMIHEVTNCINEHKYNHK